MSTRLHMSAQWTKNRFWPNENYWGGGNIMGLIYHMIEKINYVSECCEYLKDRKVISEKTLLVVINSTAKLIKIIDFPIIFQ